MTESPVSTADADDQAQVPPRGLPRNAARFVGVFVVLVLLQLTAYRYCVDSRANDWYLFQVARHTAWVLDLVGDRATLEGGGAYIDVAKARALIAGGSAETTPTADETGAIQPLTTWERWQYRAHTARQSSAVNREFGPQVTFILQAGIHHQLQQLEATRQALDSEDTSLADDIQAINTELIALRETLNEGLQDPEKRKQQQGIHFTFNVVPACGAIEVMAIFLAAVIAFPAGWGSRIWGILLGLVVLYGVNIFRLSCLAIIGAFDRGGAWFTFIHEYVWQAVYVVFVVVVWLAWVEIASRRRA